jgi:hypothetical protein
VAFLQLFTKNIEKLEIAAIGLDATVEEECRELLGLAGTCIFSNLLRTNPAFDVTVVLQRAKSGLPSELAKKVKEHVDALNQLYQQGQNEGSSGTSGVSS